MADVGKAAPQVSDGGRVEKTLLRAKGPGDDKIHTWPHLVRAEFICFLAVLAFMLVWSLLVDAPLEQPAAPTRTPNPSKAPWYFLGLQEILVFFDPWHAGVVLPSFIIVGLMVLPYIDINPKGNGYFCYADRKWEILTFFGGFHVLWIVLIVVGTFLRGPGWNWFWPWEVWDSHKVVAMSNVDLPYLFGFRDYTLSALFGLAVVGGYFVLGTGLMYWLIVRAKGREFMERWGMARFGLASFLFLNMIAVVIKLIMRMGFNIKYIMVTPWINI
ncbi:MAG TPA: cytochrome C [candidate division UBP10 bacterium]|nr:cytochrome C [Candidatus Binatota bacterium]